MAIYQITDSVHFTSETSTKTTKLMVSKTMDKEFPVLVTIDKISNYDPTGISVTMPLTSQDVATIIEFLLNNQKEENE